MFLFLFIKLIIFLKIFYFIEYFFVFIYNNIIRLIIVEPRVLIDDFLFINIRTKIYYSVFLYIIICRREEYIRCLQAIFLYLFLLYMVKLYVIYSS